MTPEERARMTAGAAAYVSNREYLMAQQRKGLPLVSDYQGCPLSDGRPCSMCDGCENGGAHA